MHTTIKLDHNWELLLYELGLDVEDVLRQANLSSDLLDREPALVESEYFELFEAIDRALGAYPLALAMQESVSLEAYPPSMLAAVCSEHFNAAIERYVKYNRLTSPLKLELKRISSGIEIRIHRREPNTVPEINGMTELVTLMRLLRHGTKKEICPLRVTIPGISPLQTLYEDYFGVRLILDTHYSITFSFEDAFRSFVTFNPLLLEHLENGLTQQLSTLEPEGTIIEQVQASIYSLLSTDQASLQAVSKKLGLSVRSLQRKLAQEHTSFREILRESRKQMAYTYLLKTSKTVAEIAFLIGYDEATFFRVFKEWTGKTPTEYRSH